jgi:hypothetical protein
VSQIVARRRHEGRESAYVPCAHEAFRGERHSPPWVLYVVSVFRTVLPNDRGRSATILIVRPTFYLPFSDAERLQTLRANTQDAGP